MNKVILRGYVGHTPKITTFSNGGKVAQFTLATTERGFTTKDGRKVEDKTTWHNVRINSNGLAGIAEKYLAKGNSVLVVGKLDNRKYQGKDGVERYITEVFVEEMELLSSNSKKDNTGESQGPATPATPANVQVITNGIEQISEVGAEIVKEMDDSPF